MHVRLDGSFRIAKGKILFPNAAQSENRCFASHRTRIIYFIVKKYGKENANKTLVMIVSIIFSGLLVCWRDRNVGDCYIEKFALIEYARFANYERFCGIIIESRDLQSSNR